MSERKEKAGSRNVLTMKTGKKERPHRGRYEDGVVTLRVRKTVEEFLLSTEPGVILGSAHELVFTPLLSDPYLHHHWIAVGQKMGGRGR